MEMPKEEEVNLSQTFYYQDDNSNSINTQAACLFVIAPVDLDTATELETNVGFVFAIY